MRRRELIGLGLFAMVASPGCLTANLAAIGSPVWLIGRVDRPLPSPSHRVALAVCELMAADGMKPEMPLHELINDPNYDGRSGPRPKPSNFQIPADYPGFWVDYKTLGPEVVNLRVALVTGKDKEERPIRVLLRVDPRRPTATVASVQVGRAGDAAASKALLGRIEERLAHPTNPAGSDGERAALQAVFGPQADKAAEPGRVSEAKE